MRMIENVPRAKVFVIDERNPIGSVREDSILIVVRKRAQKQNLLTLSLSLCLL